MAAPAKFLFDMDFGVPDKKREAMPRIVMPISSSASAERRSLSALASRCAAS